MKLCCWLSQWRFWILFSNCSITKGIFHSITLRKMLSSLKSYRKQLKILLIIHNTQIFLGSSSCSCTCPFRKYETEAIE